MLPGYFSISYSLEGITRVVFIQDTIITCLLCFLDTAAPEETKRKMYSSVLLIGGGFMFNGAAAALQSRLQAKLPPLHRKLVDQVEVIARPKVKKCFGNYC